MNKRILSMVLLLGIACSTAACASRTAVTQTTAVTTEMASVATEAMTESVSESPIPETEAVTEQSAYQLEYWTEGSKTAQSITDFVASVTDENSDSYVPQSERIAVFDVDGTLIGELFPFYFDQCLLIHRVLHDENHEPSAENKAFAEAIEKAVYAYEPEPDIGRGIQGHDGGGLPRLCPGFHVRESLWI